MSAEKKKDRPVSALDRLIQTTIGDGRSVGGTDPVARERWPSLWAWLTTIDAGRDHVKQPAIMKITAGPEGFIASLTDNDLCASLDASSGTLEGCFDALENALNGPTPAIRSWAKKQPQLRKRKQVT